MPAKREDLEASFKADLQQKPKPVTPTLAAGEVAGRRRDMTLFSLNLSRIRPDVDQVRKHHKDAGDPEIRELSESIKSEGVLQPLNVRYVAKSDFYEIVAGERRYRAAKLAGLKEVPVKIVDADEEQVKRLQLIENIHRKDLSPIELGTALTEMLDHGATVDDLCRLLHKSRPYIQKAVGIARNLSPTARKEAEKAPERFQSMAHLYEISQLPAGEQLAIVRRMHEETLNREELQRLTASAKATAKAAAGRHSGRPSKTRAFVKTIRTERGATVTVRFRKSRATTQEVAEALKDAIKTIAA